MSTFDHYLHRILMAAAEEAKADGSPAIEAQHLLLAIADDGSPALGLDRAAVRRALDQELARSLAAAGVRLDGGLPRSTPAPGGPPPLGASARAALERGVAQIPRKRDARPAHVLLGVVQAELGTVPRALALAGVDRHAVAERALQEARG